MSDYTKGEIYFYEIPDRTDDGFGYIRTDFDNIEIAHSGDTDRSQKENIANAKRIALTWNCHDDLVREIKTKDELIAKQQSVIDVMAEALKKIETFRDGTSYWRTWCLNMEAIAKEALESNSLTTKQ